MLSVVVSAARLRHTFAAPGLPVRSLFQNSAGRRAVRTAHAPR